MDKKDNAQLRDTPGLRWWHFLFVVLPAIVFVLTAWILVEWNIARDRASGYTFLTDRSRDQLASYCGDVAVTAGGIFCVVSGFVLGLTTGARSRVRAVIGWTLLCALIGSFVAIPGCGALVVHVVKYEEELL
jgi:hypothetical protein